MKMGEGTRTRFCREGHGWLPAGYDCCPVCFSEGWYERGHKPGEGSDAMMAMGWVFAILIFCAIASALLLWVA